MSKKQLPVSTAFKQSDNPKVPLPKKPKSKRKIPSTRRVKPVNKNLSAPMLASHLANDADAAQTVPMEKERQEPQAHARNTSRRTSAKRSTVLASAQPDHELEQAEAAPGTPPDQNVAKALTFFADLLDLDA